ncbi:LOW QUALITY PROTEIN: uncharacterized protein J5F26_014592 [Ciconia maguari]
MAVGGGPACPSLLSPWACVPAPPPRGHPPPVLFWHGQPGHYWSGPGEMHPISGPGLLRDPPVLPHLKQEEPHGSSTPQPRPALQCALCAPTSPAGRHHEETLSSAPVQPRSSSSSAPAQPHSAPGPAPAQPQFSPAGAEAPAHPPLQTQRWLHQRRFSACARVFATFAGEAAGSSGPGGGQSQPPRPCPPPAPRPQAPTLLELSRGDLIRICGAPDGSRLRKALPGRCPRPRLALCVSREPTGGAEGAEGGCSGPGGGVGRRGDGGRALPAPSPPSARPGPAPGPDREGRLEELAAAELAGKLAELLGLPAGRGQRVSRRGPSGSRMLASDVGGPRPRQPPRQPPGPALAGPSSEMGKELADENSEGSGFA